MITFFKYFTPRIALFMLIVMFACSAPTENSAGVRNENTMKANVIEVLDFHGKHRCESCLAIEANTRKTLETYYDDELKSNKIEFHVIDIEKPENEALADSYKVFGTALFINVIKDGKQKPIDMTNYAFKTGMEYPVFSAGLREELDKQLALF